MFLDLSLLSNLLFKFEFLGSSSASDAKPMPNGVPSSSAAVGLASADTGPIDEDLFDDEDLDELEEDLGNIEV